MTMLIPNSPGGGYDQTGRAAVAVMEDGDITGGSFEVTNVIGAGGSVAMTRLMNAEGDERTMMTVGLGVVGSLYSFGAPYKLDDATPAGPADRGPGGRARPGGLAVRDHRRPGGGLEGRPGLDRRRRRLLARRPRPPLPDAAGQRRRHRRPATSATCPTTAAARSPAPCSATRSTSASPASASSRGQLAAGELRLLAVSGEERLTGEVVSDAPTLTESGIDLVFTNWRGVFAPPGISEERRDELIAMLEEMHETPEWQQALEDNGWIDEFKTGDDFDPFLQEQDERVATTLEELDLL